MIKIPYGTTAEVKQRLNLVDTDVYDDEIKTCITDADAWVDTELKNFEDTVPLSSPPQMIVAISNDMAAAIFCENHRGEFGDMIGTYRGRAERWIARYIERTYGVWTS